MRELTFVGPAFAPYAEPWQKQKKGLMRSCVLFFHSDMTTANAPIIPYGLVAEMYGTEGILLAALGRKAFTPEEMSLITSTLWNDMFRGKDAPATYFKRAFPELLKQKSVRDDAKPSCLEMLNHHWFYSNLTLRQPVEISKEDLRAQGLEEETLGELSEPAAIEALLRKRESEIFAAV